MKNLNFYKLDAFNFHKNGVASKKKTKKEADIRDRLNTYNDNIEELYLNYKANFDKNTLEVMKAHGYEDESKSDLLSLYNYKSKLIQTFKSTITTTATNRIINTCQNCTIGEVSSFDHILPQDEFAEFVINPLNLFSSCSVCNSAKGKFWVDGGKRLFLNLYLDELPDLQYLFVNITFADNTFSTEFYLENKNGIEPNLFALIESHYNRLRLLKRFSDNNDMVIPTLQNKIRPYIGKMPLQEIINTTINSTQLNQNLFGFNYWQSILELELMRNIHFINSLKI